MSEQNDQNDQQNDTQDLSRRDFVSMSVAAGVLAASGVASAQRAVTERNVEIKTPDGTCDAVFVYPTTGTYPTRLALSEYVPGGTLGRMKRPS